jgi:hypothetical protein
VILCASTFPVFCRSYGYVNEAKVRFAQFGECASTQVDLSTLLEQTLSWAAIRDLHEHAPVRVRYDNFGSEIKKPRHCGEFVGIEAVTVGHLETAVLLPIP